MKHLFNVHAAMFGQFELHQGGKAVKVMDDQLKANAFAERENILMVISSSADFVLRHSPKLHHHFRGAKLMNAKESIDSMQKFITGCNTLQRKGKASPVYVWHLLNEYVINCIGYLESTTQPYCGQYGELLHLLNKFSKTYAPPISEQQPIEFLNSQLMQEHYAK